MSLQKYGVGEIILDQESIEQWTGQDSEELEGELEIDGDDDSAGEGEH